MNAFYDQEHEYVAQYQELREELKATSSYEAKQKAANKMGLTGRQIQGIRVIRKHSTEHYRKHYVRKNILRPEV